MSKIKVTHYEVHIPARLKKPQAPFSLAVLADMHNEVYHAAPKELADAIDDTGVSAILSAGDLVVRKGDVYRYDKTLEFLDALGGRYRVIAVNGNHESRMERVHKDQFDAWMKEASSRGLELLQNSSLPLEINGFKLHIAGLELERWYYMRFSRKVLYPADIKDKLGDPARREFNLLLAHHPKFFDAYAKWGADLTLSGHLHGGIVRLPGVGGAVSPDPGILPRYDYGRYEKGKREMIVSAGLGTHTINLRINNPAELVILDFGSGDGDRS